MTDHKGLPVPGYRPQPQWAIDAVKELKETEERLLRKVETLLKNNEVDPRWASIAITEFQKGFMAVNRSIFKPTRISLPEDTDAQA